MGPLPSYVSVSSYRFEEHLLPGREKRCPRGQQCHPTSTAPATVDLAHSPALTTRNACASLQPGRAQRPTLLPEHCHQPSLSYSLWGTMPWPCAKKTEVRGYMG